VAEGGSTVEHRLLAAVARLTEDDLIEALRALLTYSAPGGLRQGPRGGAEFPAGATTCGNGDDVREVSAIQAVSAGRRSTATSEVSR
ncbi:hypothetical protein, partial [Streptomyces sp. NPDC006334]|uniref:hypothetical protein n=1 Tax=Streptomyces sp. NPDC006334 TaxID=3156754 RepID=UPI0033A853BC